MDAVGVDGGDDDDVADGGDVGEDDTGDGTHEAFLHDGDEAG